MKKIYTGIDIGTDSIKILVCEIFKGKMNVIASAAIKSKGLRKGLIVDGNDILESLKETINNIEGKLGIKIDKIVANVPSYYADYQIVNGSITINNEDGKVTGSDITKVIQSIIQKKGSEDRELIAALPIDFSLDKSKKIKDPKGLVGKKLEVKAMMVSTPIKNVQSIISVLESVGIEVIDINISSISDYYEFRNKEIDKLNTAIINIGSETTTVSIYYKGTIFKSEVLPIGGKNIDNDISYIFKTTKEDSKKLKEKFSFAHKKFAKINEVCEMVNTNKNLVRITQYDLSQIVMARVEEILKLSKKQISLLTNKEIHYIIITGGTSELPGMSYIAEEIFGSKAKIGNIDTIGIRDNKYSVVSGMIRCLNDKLEIRGKEYSMFSLEKEEDISLPKKKLNLSADSILGKVFGAFFDN